MLIDFVIVMVGFATSLVVAPLVAHFVSRRLRQRKPPRPVNFDELMPKLNVLLKFGGDGASLALAPVALGQPSVLTKTTLQLVKYIDADGSYGLQCAVSIRPGSRFYIPNSGPGPIGNDWPRLADFLALNKVGMTQFKSADAHWSVYYHLLRLDFGRNCDAALQFVAFFFGEMLELKPSPFSWQMIGVRLLSRLTGRPVTMLTRRQIADPARQKALQQWPWRRDWDQPRAELVDLHLAVVQVLGIAGLCYSLALAGSSWRAIRGEIFGLDIAVRNFDLAFMLFFVLGVFGAVILRRAKRVRFPLAAWTIIALVTASQRLMCYALQLEMAMLMHKPKELFAPENRGFYGLFLKTSLPSSLAMRDITHAVTFVGVLTCLAVIYRWQF